MRFDKRDLMMMVLAAAVFMTTLWMTRDTIPDIEPIPEPRSYVSVSEQFMEDIKKLPDPEPMVEEPKEVLTEQTKFWRNEDTFEPLETIPMDAADQISLYHICKVNNVPMAYALAIIESESRFNENAVGSCGEVGVFQIHPINWDRFEAQDIDVHCMTGNLEAGVMMLREALDAYMEMDKATMVYKCGAGRAKELINEGVKLEICDEVSGLTMFYEELLSCGSEED